MELQSEKTVKTRTVSWNVPPWAGQDQNRKYAFCASKSIKLPLQTTYKSLFSIFCPLNYL